MAWRLVSPDDTGTGAGRRVIAAVHGMADNWTTWRDLAARLGDGYRCYAADAPWSGGGWASWGTGPGDQPDPGEPAAWVRRSLAELPEPVDVLIGHSFGANAVLDHLATRADPRVAAAVLISPLVRPRTRQPHPVMLARTRAAIREVVGEGLRARLGHRAATVDEDVFTTMVDKTFDRVPEDAASLVLHRLLDTPRPALARVDTPTLVLSGRRDQRLAGVRPTSLTVMPAAEVRIRDRYDHFCHITQAADIAAECTEFLDRVVPVPPRIGLNKEVS